MTKFVRVSPFLVIGTPIKRSTSRAPRLSRGTILMEALFVCPIGYDFPLIPNVLVFELLFSSSVRGLVVSSSRFVIPGWLTFPLLIGAGFPVIFVRVLRSYFKL